MNKREVIKTLLQDALAGMTKTTLTELRNIETLAREARSEEKHAAYVGFNDLNRKLERYSDFKDAVNRVKDAERLVGELRDKYRHNIDKEEEESVKEIKGFWDSLIWQTEVAQVRKQQMLRAKAADKQKKVA